VDRAAARRRTSAVARAIAVSVPDPVSLSLIVAVLRAVPVHLLRVIAAVGSARSLPVA
jgi:hypothetical protein